MLHIWCNRVANVHNLWIYFKLYTNKKYKTKKWKSQKNKTANIQKLVEQQRGKAEKLWFWELLGSGLRQGHSPPTTVHRVQENAAHLRHPRCKKNAAHLMQPRCKRSTEFMKLLFSKLRFISIIVFVAFQFCKFCKEDQKTPPWARNLRRHIRVSYIALISCKLPLKQGQSGFLASNGGLLYCANIVQITRQLRKRWVSLSH